MREKLGDQWFGFSDEHLSGLLTRAGFTDVRVALGARRTNDPFAVLLAVGTKKTIKNKKQRIKNSIQSMTTVDTLTRLLAERILVLDGAMGTMVQRRKLTEADFRGERFKDAPEGSQGQQRRARADAARRDRRHPRRVSRRRRRHHRDQHVQRHVGVAGRLRARGVRLRAEPRSDEARQARRPTEWTAKTPDQPRFVAGSIGPTTKTLSISPDVNNPAFRAITFDEMRDAFKDQARGLIDGGSRSAAGRNADRHAQRQGGAGRDRRSVRRERRAACR